MRLLLILTVVLSAPAYSQSKGILFDVGNFFLHTAGRSYTKLEKDNEAVSKELTECNQKLQASTEEKDKLRKSLPLCSTTYLNFEFNDNTGYTLQDFLNAGCVGKLEYTQTTGKQYKTDFQTMNGEYFDLNLKFPQIMDEIKKREMSRINYVTIYSHRLHLEMNKIYTSHTKTLNDAVVQFPYQYQYRITEGPDKRILIQYDINYLQDSHPQKLKTLRLSCLSRTLEEMDNITVKNE